jgi:hypothetical protein
MYYCIKYLIRSGSSNWAHCCAPDVWATVEVPESVESFAHANCLLIGWLLTKLALTILLWLSLSRPCAADSS